MRDAPITRRRALAYAAALAALPLDGLLACGAETQAPGPRLVGMRRDLASAHLIGRPSRSASFAATISCANGSVLPPKPPPLGQAITRTRAAGISSTWASTRCR